MKRNLKALMHTVLFISAFVVAALIAITWPIIVGIAISIFAFVVLS